MDVGGAHEADDALLQADYAKNIGLAMSRGPSQDYGYWAACLGAIMFLTMVEFIVLSVLDEALVVKWNSAKSVTILVVSLLLLVCAGLYDRRRRRSVDSLQEEQASRASIGSEKVSRLHHEKNDLARTIQLSQNHDEKDDLARAIQASFESTQGKPRADGPSSNGAITVRSKYAEKYEEDLAAATKASLTMSIGGLDLLAAPEPCLRASLSMCKSSVNGPTLMDRRQRSDSPYEKVRSQYEDDLETPAQASLGVITMAPVQWADY